MPSVTESEVIVVGCGVAGSILCYTLKRLGIPFFAYDFKPRYDKPCGEAIPLSLLNILRDAGIPPPPILNLVKSFTLCVGAAKARRITTDGLWAVIDKSAWINELRSSFTIRYEPKDPRSLVGRASLVFDCRGPYGSKGVKVGVWRAYAVCNMGCSEALILLHLRPLGMVWVFPRGSLHNIGGGFVGLPVKRSRVLALQELARLGLECTLVEEGGSAITLFPRVKLVEKVDSTLLVRVGESAGLVLPLGGEGIRPAVISALAASRSIKGHSFDPNHYVKELRKLASQVKVQTKVLKTLALTASEALAARLINCIDELYLKAWLAGELEGHRIAKLPFKLILAAARARQKGAF